MALSILNNEFRQGLSILVDPDEGDIELWESWIPKISGSSIDALFIGGSFLISGRFHQCVQTLKKANKPIILFPGSNTQIDNKADAILLLSLISGRNPDLLIGQHVQSSFALKESGIQIISTGYILVDGGKPTTVSYISNTTPIPADKPGIAAATALAGEQLGMKCIYLDAGSGALNPVPIEMITLTKSQLQIPLIVGGGLRKIKDIEKAWEAGANWVVVGNHALENPAFLSEILWMKQKTIINEI
jgi:putative glycerol-1-phosphate prenyltransferase